MVLSAISFLCGIIILQQLAVLPGLPWLIVGLILLPCGYLIRSVRPLAWVLAGFMWAWVQAALLYQHRLPVELEGRDLQVVGEVISVPESTAHLSRFLFRVQHASLAGRVVWANPGVTRLSWYGKAAALAPGQRWQLKIRLKRPNGFSNPAGFDYEGWLFQQRISATGYVRKDAANRLLDRQWNLQTVRHAVYEELKQSLQGLDNQGLILALALGIRSDISQSRWEVLQRTGTSHLIAISGLHIGLIAGLCYVLGRLLWRQFPALCLRLPAPKAAAVLAMFGAISYAYLAGLAIPTQRALVMISIVMLAILTDRSGRPSQTLAAAVMGVLIFDPAAVLSQGFWLSFSAVAVLLYGMSGRYGRFNGWRNWGRAQWIVGIGLLPLMLFLFQMASVVSPLVNMIAIPWVSLLIVPLVLSGTAALFLFAPLGRLLLQLADLLLSPLQLLMSNMAGFSFSQWVQPAPALSVLLLSVFAVMLLLAPAGLPVKRIGLILILPLFLLRADAIPHADVRFTVLDVGQGLATVIETRHHVLVYDAGPKFSDRFDTGDAVVVPYLHRQGIRHIDAMVISHGDNDHRGGYEAIARHMDIDKLYSGVPEKLAQYAPLACERGMQWHWDGVRFSFLHPDRRRRFTNNDRSCVLRIDAPGGSILLTGDIHKKSERHLLAHQAGSLAADILVAPHHGSKTSSHADFVSRVAARYVIFPSGYRNRFRHPHHKVLQRYQKTGAILLDSARHGAIQFHIKRDHGVSSPVTYRQRLARHWNRD